MNILEYETLIPTAEEADNVLTMIGPLIKDEDGGLNDNNANNERIDPEEFAEEQGIVARYLNQFL